MFGGLIAAVVGLFAVNEWTKEDVAEKERRKKSKSKYYVDKWGKTRVVATGRKVTGEDVAEDIRRWKENENYALYNIYKKHMEDRNKDAEENRLNCEWWGKKMGRKPKYNIACIKYKILTFDEWMSSGGKPKSTPIKDEVFYSLQSYTQ